MKKIEFKRGCINSQLMREKAAAAFKSNDEIYLTKCVRLVCYLDYVIKNGGKPQWEMITAEEYKIIKSMVKLDYIMIEDDRIYISREFYNVMCELLWDSYVMKFDPYVMKFETL